VSWASARFFAWIQRAPFYEATHAEAVQLLPPGSGRTWLDVGCGPGLVGRLAGRQGYDVVGVDHDPAMVRLARRLGGDRCSFEVGALGPGLVQVQADVVSAASLLIVLPDPREGLGHLWHCVKPGGTLLVVETTAAMTPEGAQRVVGRQHPALFLWARARRGRAVAPSLLDELDVASRRHRFLLQGLVQAWALQKAAS
jgi:SAM-dependent methyltransferase